MASSSSPLDIPGTFRFEYDHDYDISHLNCGAKAHLFQPPHTPSASSSLHLARSTASLYSIDSERSTTAGRKRPRTDYARDEKLPRLREQWSMDGVDSISSAMMDMGSPSPLVNTRYTLAGGMDIQMATARTQDDEDNSQPEIGYRRRLGPADLQETYGERESLSRYPSDVSTIPTGWSQLSSGPSFVPEHGDSWRKAALDLVGGVVGKMWEFCKASAFRGFYAGGGDGYELTQPLPAPMEDTFWQDENIAVQKSTSITPSTFAGHNSTAAYEEQSSRESTPPRAAKRRVVEPGDGEIGKNWILVPPQRSTKSPSPSRTYGSPRPQSRFSMPTSASSRRSTLASYTARPLPKRTVQGTPRTSRVSHAGSPSLVSARPASFASSRSPRSHDPLPLERTHTAPQSPASIEAQKWAAKKRKEEREADASMKRLNKQLRDMIREGKEALGSTVEVDFGDDMVDEGFEDGFADIKKSHPDW